MSEILKLFIDTVRDDRPQARLRHQPDKQTWYLILDCGHWYHWTGNAPPKPGGDFPCPDCKPPIQVVTVGEAPPQG